MKSEPFLVHTIEMPLLSTFADNAVSVVTVFTRAGKASDGVDTVGSRITLVRAKATFINV